jgi:hypothetical protein
MAIVTPLAGGVKDAPAAGGVEEAAVACPCTRTLYIRTAALRREGESGRREVSDKEMGREGREREGDC